MAVLSFTARLSEKEWCHLATISPLDFLVQAPEIQQEYWISLGNKHIFYHKKNQRLEKLRHKRKTAESTNNWHNSLHMQTCHYPHQPCQKHIPMCHLLLHLQIMWVLLHPRCQMHQNHQNRQSQVYPQEMTAGSLWPTLHLANYASITFENRKFD